MLSHSGMFTHFYYILLGSPWMYYFLSFFWIHTPPGENYVKFSFCFVYISLCLFYLLGWCLQILREHCLLTDFSHYGNYSDNFPTPNDYRLTKVTILEKITIFVWKNCPLITQSLLVKIDYKSFCNSVQYHHKQKESKGVPTWCWVPNLKVTTH